MLTIRIGMAEEGAKDSLNPYKIKAFQKAIRTIKQLKAPIQSPEDLELVSVVVALEVARL